MRLEVDKLNVLLNNLKFTLIGDRRLLLVVIIKPSHPVFLKYRGSRYSTVSVSGGTPAAGEVGLSNPLFSALLLYRLD